MQVSPLLINVALHYYTTPTDHPMIGNKVHDEAIEYLCKNNLLRPTIIENSMTPLWEGTDKLAAWIEALCSVPFPVTKYVIEWPKSFVDVRM